MGGQEEMENIVKPRQDISRREYLTLGALGIMLVTFLILAGYTYGLEQKYNEVVHDANQCFRRCPEWEDEFWENVQGIEISGSNFSINVDS